MSEGSNGGRTVAFAYDAVGNLTSLTPPEQPAHTFAYNGALPATTTWTGPVVRGSVEAWYDEVLRPSGLMVGGRPLGSIFYSRDGLPTNIGALTLDYRSDNALLESVRGGRALTTFAYDSLGQVLRAATVHDVNDDTLFRQGFTYDRLGRLIGLAERVQSDTATYAYGYDAAGRLAEVRAGGVVTATYTYDLNGNRTRVVTPSRTITAAYDAQDRLLSAGTATYVHAATGERTLKIVGTDTARTRYDAFGNLRDVYLPTGTHVAYVVDAQQRRTARLVNGVVTNRWLFQSQLAIAAEVDSAGNPVRMFSYGSHGNVPELMTLADGTQYRLVTDHLGSVRLVIDVAADTVVQRLAYDAYGRVVVDTKPGFQPFGYAGGVYDPLTGLVRFGARDYDAESGRWTARDPIGFGGGSPNLYEYSANEPVDAADTEGERIRFLNDNTGMLSANWQHLLRALALQAQQGSLGARRVLVNARNAEASPLDYVFEDVESGPEYGRTDPYSTRMRINRRSIIRHACNEYVNIATVMLHEFGHAQYNISPGASLRYDSGYSGEQALFFENAYRSSVNMPRVLNHGEMPRRKQ